MGAQSSNQHTKVLSLTAPCGSCCASIYHHQHARCSVQQTWLESTVVACFMDPVAQPSSITEKVKKKECNNQPDLLLVCMPIHLTRSWCSLLYFTPTRHLWSRWRLPWSEQRR